MSTSAGPSLSANGLVFHFDTDSPRSYLGATTTNIDPTQVPGNYNNVPGDVTTTIVATEEKYQGQIVYKQTLTPTTVSGVSYLTAGANPGLGIVYGGGGGLANRYTGHSIFFKPTVRMHSSPIFTHYSNVGGWQSSANFDRLWDGWYRAHVIWYDTVTRSDGKYWAINPATSTINIPITMYWAAPFKEDSNRSGFVSRYTSGTRSNTGSLIDLTGNFLIDVSSALFDDSEKIVYNGNQNVSAGNLGSQFSNYTVEIWFKSSDVANYRNPIDCNWLQYNGSYSNIGPRLEQNGAGVLGWVIGDTSGNYEGYNLVPSGMDPTKYHHAVITKNGSSIRAYYNGNVSSGGTAAYTHTGTFADVQIGRGFSTSSERWFRGSIPVVRIYNRALSHFEVTQNYQSQRARFSL